MVTLRDSSRFLVPPQVSLSTYNWGAHGVPSSARPFQFGAAKLCHTGRKATFVLEYQPLFGIASDQGPQGIAPRSRPRGVGLSIHLGQEHFASQLLREGLKPGLGHRLAARLVTSGDLLYYIFILGYASDVSFAGWS